MGQTTCCVCRHHPAHRAGPPSRRASHPPTPPCAAPCHTTPHHTPSRRTSLAEAYSTGKSSWSLQAPRCANTSNTAAGGAGAREGDGGGWPERSGGRLRAAAREGGAGPGKGRGSGGTGPAAARGSHRSAETMRTVPHKHGMQQADGQVCRKAGTQAKHAGMHAGEQAGRQAEAGRQGSRQQALTRLHLPAPLLRGSGAVDLVEDHHGPAGGRWVGGRGRRAAKGVTKVNRVGDGGPAMLGRTTKGRTAGPRSTQKRRRRHRLAAPARGSPLAASASTAQRQQPRRTQPRNPGYPARAPSPPQPPPQRLLHDKLGLAEGPLVCIHQQHRAIHHAQHTAGRAGGCGVRARVVGGLQPAAGLHPKPPAATIRATHTHTHTHEHARANAHKRAHTHTLPPLTAPPPRQSRRGRGCPPH